VLLDVSVLDRNQRAIKGLTAADFTILEDGVPQSGAPAVKREVRFSVR
jgi:hypothetical protein